MKTLLISWANKGREDYPKALKRNIKEALKHYKGDVAYYSDDAAFEVVEGIKINPSPTGLPSHKDTPYGFKPFLFNKAFEEGYEQVLWLDSTIVVEADLEPIFKLLNKWGVLAFHNLGHNLKEWISDAAINTTGLNIEEDPKQIMACVVGFDITNETGKRIFKEWLELSKDGVSFQNNGSTRPGFKAHRHDQAILSALVHKNKLPLLPYGVLVYEPHNETKEFGDEIYFTNKAIKP